MEGLEGLEGLEGWEGSIFVLFSLEEGSAAKIGIECLALYIIDKSY